MNLSLMFSSIFNTPDLVSRIVLTSTIVNAWRFSVRISVACGKQFLFSQSEQIHKTLIGSLNVYSLNDFIQFKQKYIDYFFSDRIKLKKSKKYFTLYQKSTSNRKILDHYAISSQVFRLSSSISFFSIRSNVTNHLR